MADRPILFSAPMVRAILDGRKTQTRRVLSDGNVHDDISSEALEDFELQGWEGFYRGETLCAARYNFAPLDRLWVRETWTARMDHGWTIADARSRLFNQKILYAADEPRGSIDGWWPSIHMPREFSRTTLLVNEVRVQRLQDISEADATAEGITKHGRFFGVADADWDHASTESARMAYANLWDSLNAKRGFGWDANPWVVAITFDVVRANIDRLHRPA